MKSKENSSQGIAHNALCQGTIIKGNIFAESDLRIDGIVEGKIECKGKIVLGSKGEVYGNIDCDSAELMGKLKGEMFVRANVSIKQTGNVHGKVHTQSIDIEPGAVFNGTCKMQGSPEDEE